MKKICYKNAQADVVHTFQSYRGYLVTWVNSSEEPHEKTEWFEWSR